MMAATARISPMLAMVEPTAFPTAVSGEPEREAMRETVNSGMVVARLTMVAPISTLGSLVYDANQMAESANQSPPLTMNKMPSPKRRMVSMMDSNEMPPYRCEVK